MSQVRCGRAASLVALGLFIAAASPVDHSALADAGKSAVTSQSHGSASAPTTTAASQPVSGHRIQYRFKPGKKLYYIIENEFTDHGGVPGLLTYITFVKDRRVLVQTVVEDPARPKGPAVKLQWKCDRYEVREKGMKDDVEFDSLRLTFPPAQLNKLGTIPGSRVTFTLDPVTGRTSERKIVRGKMTGPSSRKKLSSTADRCSLNDKNLQKLMDDLGTLFLPGRPVEVGETWTTSRRDDLKNSGASVIDYTFKLEQIAEEKKRRVAHVSINGFVKLEQPKTPEKPAAKRRGRQKNQKPRKFTLDHAICSGTLKFDMTAGELIGLSLRREMDRSAEIEAEDSPGMKLQTGYAHVLNVKVQHTEPPKPVIVGGPRPPADAKSRQPARTVRKPTTRPNRNVAKRPTGKKPGRTTTRPGVRRPRVNRKPPDPQTRARNAAAKRRLMEQAKARRERRAKAASQPANRPPVKRPTRATSRPAGRPPVKAVPKPTSRPATKPPAKKANPS